MTLILKMTDVSKRQKDGTMFFKRGTQSFNVEVTLSPDGVFKTTAKRGNDGMTLVAKEIDSYQWGASKLWQIRDDLTAPQQRAIALALQK